MSQLHTFIGDEIGVVVFYSVTPSQKQTMTDPAIEAEIELESVLVGGESEADIIGILSSEVLDDIEQRIWASLEEDHEG
jgi:hypothetical protein